jgi:hypothetical protein
MFGGKGKADTSTASLATTTTFCTQEDEDENERIRRPSPGSLAFASSRPSETPVASTSAVSTTNNLALLDKDPTTPFERTFPESAAPSATTLSPTSRGRGSPNLEAMLVRSPRPRRGGSAIAADRITRLSRASVSWMSLVGSIMSRGLAKIAASKMRSSRSLPARRRDNGPGKIEGGSSRAINKFSSTLDHGMHDEPEFVLGDSILNSNSNPDAGSVSGSEEGVVRTAAWICIHRYRKSFHRFLTSKRLTDMMYVQVPHVPRRITFAPLEAIRSYSQLLGLLHCPWESSPASIPAR